MLGTTLAAALHEIGCTPRICDRTAREGLELQVDGGRLFVPGPVQIDSAHVWCGHGCLRSAEGRQAGIDGRGISLRSPGHPSIVWFLAQAPDGSVRLRGEARLALPDTPASRAVIEAPRGTRCSIDLATDFKSVAWRKLPQNAVAGLMVLTDRRAAHLPGPISRGRVWPIRGSALRWLAPRARNWVTRYCERSWTAPRHSRPIWAPLSLPTAKPAGHLIGTPATLSCCAADGSWHSDTDQ